MRAVNLMATCKAVRDDIYQQLYQGSMFSFLFNPSRYPDKLFLKSRAFSYITNVTIGPLNHYSGGKHKGNLVADTDPNETDSRIARISRAITFFGSKCQLECIGVLLSKGDADKECKASTVEVTNDEDDYREERKKRATRKTAQKRSTTAIWWGRPFADTHDNPTILAPKVVEVIGSNGRVTGARYVKYVRNEKKDVVEQGVDLPSFTPIVEVLEQLKSNSPSLKWIGYGVEKEICFVPVCRGETESSNEPGNKGQGQLPAVVSRMQRLTLDVL